MNIQKNKMALALSAVLLLSLPVSAFAHEKHCEVKDTQLGDYMKYMKSELRGYVKGFKGGDQEKMQLHINELLKLSELAVNETPVKVKMLNDDKSAMQGMDHSQMDHSDMADMKGMDHSQMAHSDMVDMKGMDHSQMDHSDKTDMKGMDHSQMDHSDMADMKGMDHSQMEHSDKTDMKGMDHSQMDHSDMTDMQGMDHGSMAGMTDQQHHLHMMYMQGMTKLQDLFKALESAQDKEQVKTILGQIKEHSKKSHQAFRQDCS
ncbi:hypothetical protein [Psychromonas ossibalaenae]|uniref:hypothetical protein n=1 Tax=Psychromonas ossibalaenae TaxID=444922 RepID=UPI0003622171|nr:hypothetical protein [Psychromonas ossibalaenae]